MKNYILFIIIFILSFFVISNRLKAQCSVNIGPDKTICMGSQVKIGKDVNAYTYSWSNSATLSSATDSTPMAYPVVNTTYVVTVDFGNGCIITDDVVVTVVNSPTVTVCSNKIIAYGLVDTLWAVGSGTIGPYSYQWSPTYGLYTPNDDTTFVSPVDTTIYTVTVTDANGCTNTGEVWVTAYNCPNYPIA